MSFTIRLDADIVRAVSTGRTILYDISDAMENLTEDYRTTILVDTGTADTQIAAPLVTGARVLVITTDYRVTIKLNVNTQSPAIPVDKTLILFCSDEVPITSVFVSNSSGYRATVNMFIGAMG